MFSMKKVRDISSKKNLNRAVSGSNHEVITSRINVKTKVSDFFPPEKKTGRDRNAYCLQRTIRPALLIALICGFFPVKGILAKDPADLSFSYFSKRALYSYMVTFASASMGIMSLVRIIIYGIQLSTAGDIMFFMGNAVCMLVFIHLATNWKELMVAWHEVECLLPPVKVETKVKIYAMIVTITFLSLFEHVSADVNTLATILHEEPLSWTLVEHYFKRSYKMMFAYVPYNVILGFLFSLINLVDVIVWNYMDLMIIIISIALTDLFRLLNKLFDKTQQCVLDRDDWTHLRNIFNKLQSLVSLVDNKLSLVILISISSNLYFICLQLLNSLRPMKTLSQRVYFYSSFGYLMTRTLVVCLAAASIPIEAMYPLKVLYAIPSHTFNVETQRLITQITAHEISLTGCNFFSLNRNLIITILGTIITYEVVLVQFNYLTDETSPPAENATL